MQPVFYVNRAMIPLHCGNTFKLSGHPIQFLPVALARIGPDPDPIRHKAQLEDSIPIIETFHLHFPVLKLELCTQMNVHKGVSLFLSLQGQLKNTPLLYFLHVVISTPFKKFCTV